MSTYGITFIADEALAGGHEFAFVELPGNTGFWIFYRESALGPVSLEDSWAAYRALISGGVGPQDPEREDVGAQLARQDLPQRHLWAM